MFSAFIIATITVMMNEGGLSSNIQEDDNSSEEVRGTGPGYSIKWTPIMVEQLM